MITAEIFCNENHLMLLDMASIDKTLKAKGLYGAAETVRPRILFIYPVRH